MKAQEDWEHTESEKKAFHKLKALADYSNVSYVSCELEDLKNLIKYAERRTLVMRKYPSKLER